MNGLSTFDIAGVTDVGKVRTVNEDALIIDRDHALFAVADGMGGHGAGDVASQMAVESLHHSLSDCLSRTMPAGSELQEHYYNALLESITTANDNVYGQNHLNGFQAGTGMGTTLVGLCYIGRSNRAIVFNIGDSRLYRYREGELTQLTRDHTMYQEWEETGRVGPAPPKNIIMRALGLFPEVDIDLSVETLEPNDTLLLCSDGLSGMVDDTVLHTSLANHAEDSAENVSRRLVEIANDNGGEDNVTVITIRHAAELALSL